MKSTLFAAAVALASALPHGAQDPAQTVDASLDALGGDWVMSESGDLAATAAGQVLTFSWADERGLPDVEILLRINFRHLVGRRPALSLNGCSLGELDEARNLEAQDGVSYAGEYLLNVPAGAFIAGGNNEFSITTTDDAGGSVALCQPEGAAYALQLTIQDIGTQAPAEPDVQVIEAPLALIEGDGIDSGCGGEDRSLTGDGQSYSFSWTDSLGSIGEKELSVEINWRYLHGARLEGFLNVIPLGALDLPPTFECLDDVFYPTLHHFRLPEGAYFPDEVNRFTLTMFAASTLGASVGICEPPGHAVAMRFFVRPYVDERERRNAPTYPQAVVLMDVTTGTILRPGVAIDSPDLQIMAVLADPDGDMAALEIEYQLVGSDEIGTMTIQSQQFEPGTQVVVQLPSLGPGLWLIRVRAIDSTGEVSPWVPVDPVIRVARFGVQQTYTGVSRAEVEDALRVIPIDSGISLEVRDSGSGGGACSAGARFGTDGVLAGIAVLILIGAARRRLA